MSANIETLSINFFNQKMPVLWAPFSYPTMKPLNSYFSDLVDRLNMLQTWMDNGPPIEFWISGFFFTHAFLTGVLQNYARKYRIPIDTVCFEFITLKKDWDFSKKPEDGVYVGGMSIEGARWDNEDMVIVESLEKVEPYTLNLNIHGFLALSCQRGNFWLVRSMRDYNIM